MDEDKYIRGLSDGELMRMLNLDRDRYTKPEIAVAEKEMERRMQAKAPGKPAEPGLPEAPAAPEGPETARPETAGTDGGGEEEPLDADVEELIRSLSIESLSDMVNVHAGRYSRAQLDVAFDEINKRMREGEEPEPEAPPEPEEAPPAAADADWGDEEADADEEEYGDESGDEADAPQPDAGEEARMRALSNEELIGMLKDARAGTHTESELEAAVDELSRRGRAKTVWTGSAARCAWCGKAMPGDAKYCMECGRKLDGTDAGKPGQPGMRVVIGVVIAFVIFFIISMSSMCR